MIMPNVCILLASIFAFTLAVSANPSKPSVRVVPMAPINNNTICNNTICNNTIITNTPHFTYDELYKLLTNFWDNFLYPADGAQAKSINSTLLSENVQGRMDATRTFDGRELNTEYLFGLFANLAATPSSISLLGVPISYEVLKFAANDYISSASTRVMFNMTSLNLIVPIEIETWTTWNSLGQMTQYDGIFKYWQWLLDTVIEAA
ncbi:hypothetical protein D0Z07_6924 [Hyphodiscus hymeniophilus]|uniref:Uncharacterized protein n=1 Tax=Hyphodiscus hymeniophilus TaxID=353542 RepID=A0A9P7AV28_9HELO|nr:hypothetical protein D0Z07_6924 [Hyphodiscus hymeniophilus]